jgi:hypothetical protein
MEEKKYISELPVVEAPPGFESQVLARVRDRKVRAVRRRRWEFGLAGAAAAALVITVLISPGPKRPEYPASQAQVKADNSSAETIEVMEPLNLENEMRRATADPQTVFILEKVSDQPLIQQVRY